jgi:NitT/TauT family transport system substrate-binding protein
MKNHFVKFVLLVLMVSMLFGCAPTPQPTSTPAAEASMEPAPELVHVKVSILPFLSYAPFFIAQDEGYFAEQNLEVEFVRLQSGAENITALLSGQIDVFAGIASVALLNSMAQDVNMRIVADKGYLASNGCSSTVIMARKELIENGTLDDITRIKDLRYSLFGGNITEFFLDRYLAGSGISTDDLKDNDLNIQSSQGLDALVSGTADLVNASEPWITRILNSGSAEIYLDYAKLAPDASFSFIVYGPTFLDKKTDVGQRFMVAYLKALKQYKLGPTERNIEIISSATQITPEELKTLCWQPIHENGMIDNQTVLDFQDWAVEKGYLAQAIPVEKFWEPSFIDFANDQLK